MRQQVISKIHWGARSQEVLDWLQEQHAVTGVKADQLLAEALTIRRRAVRTRALIRLVLSAIGIAISASVIWMRFLGGPMIFVSVQSFVGGLLLIALGIYSIGIFFRSLSRLLTGEMSGSVD